MKKRKAALGFLLKALVSLGVLGFVLSRLDLAQFYAILSAADLSYLGLAIGAYFAAKIITAARWALLARPLEFENSFKEFAVFYFFGMFLNLFAPSTLGGDAGRVYYLSRGDSRARAETWRTSMSRALISVAADRAVGLVVLVWIGAVALLAFPEYAGSVPWIARYLIIGAALGSLGAGLLLPFTGAIFQSLRRPFLDTLRETVSAYRAKPGLITQAILLSGLVHLIQTWIQILLGRAINVDIPWSYCFIFFPLVDILSTLPLSVSGIGLREGGYFFFLGKLGIGPEAAIACGILWFTVMLVNGIIGGVIFVLYRRNSLTPSVRTSPAEDEKREMNIRI